MINYARHDEEFYGYSNYSMEKKYWQSSSYRRQWRDSCLYSKSCMHTNYYKETDDGRTVRGIGFAKWMQFSDEDFFILREKDILLVSSMSKEVSLCMNHFVMGDDDEKKDSAKLELQPEMGYLGNVSAARHLLRSVIKLFHKLSIKVYNLS